MSKPACSRRVMQSALDQWDAVNRLTESARQLLPPEEVEEVAKTTTESAGRSLQLLERVHRGQEPADEPLEHDLRDVLERLMVE